MSTSFKLKGWSPFTQKETKETQKQLDKQAKTIRDQMRAGNISPDEARKQLLVIQNKMKELGTIPK